MIPTIDELRSQCRIDGDQEDAILTLYAEAARDAARDYLNRNLYDEKVPEEDTTGLLVTAKVKLAIMLSVGHWYTNREETSTEILSEIPMGFQYLLRPQRIIPL